MAASQTLLISASVMPTKSSRSHMSLPSGLKMPSCASINWGGIFERGPVVVFISWGGLEDALLLSTSAREGFLKGVLLLSTSTGEGFWKGILL